MMLLRSLFSLLAIVWSLESFASNDLLESYRLALKNDPNLKVAKASYNAGLNAEDIARSALLPQLSAFGSYQNSDSDTEGLFPITLDQDQNPITPEIRALRPVNNQSDERVDSWGLQLTQTVFDASQWFSFQQGRMETKVAKLQFATDQQDLILRVTEAYFDILRATDNLIVARKQEDADRQQVTQAQKRARTGLSAQTDVFQAQAAYDLSQARRLTDENLVGEARDTLKLITGEYQYTLSTLDPLFSPTLPTPLDPAEWTHYAQTKNLSLKVAESESLAAKAAARRFASAHLPTVNAELRYSRSDTDTHETDDGLDYDYESNTDTTLVTLNVELPLYTGGGTSARRKQAYYQYHETLEIFQGLRRDIARETATVYRKTLSDVNRFERLKQAVASNQKAFEATQKSYSIGVSSISDVLNVQRSLYSATRDLNNTRYDYILNNLKLKQLAGTLSPADVSSLNDQLRTNKTRPEG